MKNKKLVVRRWETRPGKYIIHVHLYPEARMPSESETRTHGSIGKVHRTIVMVTMTSYSLGALMDVETN